MKKKLVCLIITVFAFASLTGCAIPKGTETSNSGSTTKIHNRDFYEFIDPDTGVHYWVYSHAAGYTSMGGMTPRLNSDGTVMTTK